MDGVWTRILGVERTLTRRWTRTSGRRGRDVTHVVGRGNGLPTWFATSLVLSALGPDGRRAARHGAVAATVGSAVNTFVVKPSVGRRRPEGAHRTTMAFASGHTTTGSACATAVWLTWPPAGPPCAVLAALVGAGRVRDGEHHLGDVLAGAVLGATTAAVIHRLQRALDRR